MQFFFDMVQDMAEQNEAIATLVAMWPFALAFVAALIGMTFVMRSRRQMSAERAGDGASLGLSTRLSDADLASYELDGAPAPQPKGPTVNMDDFFSNADRRAELGGNAVPEPAPVRMRTDHSAPAETEAVHRAQGETAGDTAVLPDAGRVREAAALLERSAESLQAAKPKALRRPKLLFPLPGPDALPSPKPGETAPSGEAAARVVSFLSAADARQKSDPDYRPSVLERRVKAAYNCQMAVAPKLATYLRAGPKPKLMARYAENAEFLGAPDLAAVLSLGQKLTAMVASPEFPPYHEDDPQWSDALATAEQLEDLFGQVNRSDGNAGRLVTLADELIATTG